MTHRLSQKLAVWFTIALPLAALIPWIAVQWNRSVNGNVAWLSICAQRWLSGIPLSKGCYDTNPPMSVLLYTPPVLLHNATGLETYYGIYALTLGLIAFSVMAVWIILKDEPTLKPEEKALLLGSYLLAVTVLSSISFADRDHIIAIGLLPLVLTQRAITNHVRIPALTKYPVLVFGTLCLLIKPYFVIIPTYLILLRLIKQKRHSIIFDPDALIIAIGVLAYTAILLLFFQDFLNIMLPDIVKYYLPYNNPDLTWTNIKPLSLVAGASLAIGYCSTLKDKEKRHLLLILNLSCLGCLLAYGLQMKGLSYQILPFYAFLVPALILGLYPALSSFLKNERLLTLILIGVCIIAIYIRAPLRPNYPTHDDYKNAELTNFIQQNCGNPCSFVLTHENMEIISQTAFYSGGLYATRFPVHWYIPLLENNPFPVKAKERQHGQNPEQDKTRERLASYTAEDLKLFSPNIILVLTTQSEGTESPPFDYFDYFSENQEFQKQAEKFKKTGTFKTDRAYYFRDTRFDYKHTLNWDVYTKTDTQTNRQTE